LVLSQHGKLAGLEQLLLLVLDVELESQCDEVSVAIETLSLVSIHEGTVELD